MKPQNTLELKISAKLENESFLRSTAAAFAVCLNPSLEEINDIKTLISEAVTNSIVHAYEKADGVIVLRIEIYKDFLHIEIEDFGKGILDIEKAMQPFFTTKPEQERSGMGFTVMSAFCDELKVENKSTGGLKVVMKKNIGKV